MTTPGVERKTIAIIGGGVSGTLTAYHLLQQDAKVRVVVIDPRPELGLGLAYSTPSLRHLLNVPAGKISAFPDDPMHFLNWLRCHHDPQATIATFAPRAVFGRYIQFLLSEEPEIEQVRSAVTDCRLDGAGAVLVLENGRKLKVDRVVLATGNFDPAPLPGISKAAKSSGVYCQDAWSPNTYEGLDENAKVTLIGTGLTSVDVLLRLRELGHRGTITALSRHGVFPARHAEYLPISTSAIPANTPARCVTYLRAFRTALRNGADWRAVADSLRPVTNDLWLALSRKEQLRFRRHLQRRWDVIRHRMAPSIADLIDAEMKDGTLVVRKGHLEGVKAVENGARVSIRTTDQIQTLSSDRIINCTGPSMNYRNAESPLLKSLFAQGLVSPGPLGGGFNCSRSGAVIDAKGRISQTIFNIGPGRLGTLLESIAIPEIRQQAFDLAIVLTDIVAQSDSAKPVLVSRKSTPLVPESNLALVSAS
jgi:uncharacterized NAD(P)/FAD-binding protein YdhS